MKEMMRDGNGSSYGFIFHPPSFIPPLMSSFTSSRRAGSKAHPNIQSPSACKVQRITQAGKDAQEFRVGRSKSTVRTVPRSKRRCRRKPRPDKEMSSQEPINHTSSFVSPCGWQIAFREYRCRGKVRRSWAETCGMPSREGRHRSIMAPRGEGTPLSNSCQSGQLPQSDSFGGIGGKQLIAAASS